MVLILDNGTTAMTGMQEHPGTGRTLAHARTGKFVFEELVARHRHSQCACDRSHAGSREDFKNLIQACLNKPELSVVIARRDCLLAHASIREYERCNEQQAN